MEEGEAYGLKKQGTAAGLGEKIMTPVSIAPERNSRKMLSALPNRMEDNMINVVKEGIKTCLVCFTIMFMLLGKKVKFQ